MMLAFLGLAGMATLFGGSKAMSNSTFYCNTGCSIPIGYYNDSYCDCESCEDEPDWTCSTCGGCPTNQTSNGTCLGTVNCDSMTYAPVTTETPFYCNSGCHVPMSWYNDSYCDCESCEDEPDWTCHTCNEGCPANLTRNGTCNGSSRYCISSSSSYGNDTTTTYIPGTTEYPFYCYTGCHIPMSWYSDSYCDCQMCEDEPFWNCTTCGGCPINSSSSGMCTGGVWCEGTTGGNRTTYTPWTTKFKTTDTRTTEMPFYCDTGCHIPYDFFNDSYCDCESCEDEPLWTCSECGGCPSNQTTYGTCQGYVECDDSSDETTNTPGTTETPFYCDTGCHIPISWYNDSYCDCESCEDEPDWTCNSCGGCPSNQGSSGRCDGYIQCNSTNGFTTTSNTIVFGTTSSSEEEGTTSEGGGGSSGSSETTSEGGEAETTIIINGTTIIDTTASPTDGDTSTSGTTTTRRFINTYTFIFSLMILYVFMIPNY